VMRLAHIVNPVVVDESSDLYVAQPVTFETMRVARKFARGQVDVTLFSAQYPEDRSLVPDDFVQTPDLERSILDFGRFERRRKLPLLRDVLDRLYDASDADYLIYTNVDIALQPHFYLAVSQFIEQGYDALVINRRTITDSYQSVEEIPLMYAEAGEAHPGHDCFVFRRKQYQDYTLANVCVGAPWVGRVLLWNLACRSASFQEFNDKHLTFHLGNDKAWKAGHYADYAAYNEREARQVYGELAREHGPFSEASPISPYLDVLGPHGSNQKALSELQAEARSAAGRLRRLLVNQVARLFGKAPG